MAGLYAPGGVVSVRALLVGERIDLKGLEATQRASPRIPSSSPPVRASTPRSSATARSSYSG